MDARKSIDGRTQLLTEHQRQVAELAGLFAGDFGLSSFGIVSGKHHDEGKRRPEYQRYLHENNAKRGSVQHSVYGAELVYANLINSSSDVMIAPIAEIVANCIASHHGNLRDFLTPDGTPQLLQQMNSLQPTGVGVFDTSTDKEALISSFNEIINKAPDKAFAYAMITLLLHSCLVDADRLDAYLFEANKEYEPESVDWGFLLHRLETSLNVLRRKHADVSEDILALREEVSIQCAKSGLRKPGIYQLSVPTGGGKTLSSLRFAIEHARAHNMKRIIYVIPYLSIIDQAAREIREVLQVDDSTVIEHHSSVVLDEDANPEFYKLHIDRWDSPIIITTQVQFLESLFSAKSSKLRKVHNMTNAVIVFDEVQSLPVKCINLFNSAMNFLSKVCGSTVLLCTATQPLLDSASKPILISKNASIARTVTLTQRTQIVNKLSPAGYSHAELASLAIEKLDESMLIIVNTKADARTLCEEISKRGVTTFHLSTNMCPNHRIDVMEAMKQRLESLAENRVLYKSDGSRNSEAFICVSTQLIEAGVDISFKTVIRALAGLDSIWQAAGRCNRHGEFHCVCDVIVVNIKGENLSKLPDIRTGADITRRLFNEGKVDINEYYKHYFYAQASEMDYKTNSGTLYDLYTMNSRGYGEFGNRVHSLRPSLLAGMASAAKEFYVIAPGQTGVIVPYSKNDSTSDLASTCSVVSDTEMLNELDRILRDYAVSDDLDEKQKLVRGLGRYTVSLFEYQMDELRRSGALTEYYGMQLLDKGFYDKVYGIDFQGSLSFLCE